MLSLGVSTHFSLEAASSDESFRKLKAETRGRFIPRAVSGELVLKVRKGETLPAELADAVTRISGDFFKVQTAPGSRADEIIRRCREKKVCGFEDEPNYVFTIPTNQSEESAPPPPSFRTEQNEKQEQQVGPNDPRVPDQWHLKGLLPLWEVIKTTSHKVKLVVLDTGFTPGPEINANYMGSILPDYPDPYDIPLGHGTSVASVMCETTNNGLDGAGVIQSCASLWVIKVARQLTLYNDNGEEIGQTAVVLFEDVIRALDLIKSQTAEDDLVIVNMSFGADFTGYERPQFFIDKMEEMGDRFVFVTSLGNDGKVAEEHYPSAAARDLESVVAVGATDEDGHRAVFSNWSDTIGSRLVYLPGVNILTAGTPQSGLFGVRHGTSFSAPIGSGLLGLIAQAMIDRGVTPTGTEVVRALTDNQPKTPEGLVIPRPWIIAGNITGQKIQGWLSPTINTQRGVVNFGGGDALAPGSLAWVSGLDLQGDQNQTPEVWFGAFRAYVLEASSRSILVQVPTELGVGDYFVSVNRLDGSSRSNEVLVSLGQTAPVVLKRTFGLLFFPSPLGVVTNEKGGLVGDPFFYPLKREEKYTLWCTGLGATVPLVPTGQVSPSEPLAWTSNPVSLRTESGKKVQVDYSGLAPDFVGLFQINFTIPEEVESGLVEIILNAGGEEDKFWTSIK